MGTKNPHKMNQYYHQAKLGVITTYTEDGEHDEK